MEQWQNMEESFEIKKQREEEKQTSKERIIKVDQVEKETIIKR